MELTIHLSRTDLQVAVFCACTKYNLQLPKEYFQPREHVRKQAEACLEILWKKRAALLNKKRVAKSRAGGLKAGAPDEDLAGKAQRDQQSKDAVEEAEAPAAAAAAERVVKRRIRSKGGLSTAAVGGAETAGEDPDDSDVRDKKQKSARDDRGPDKKQKTDRDDRGRDKKQKTARDDRGLDKEQHEGNQEILSFLL